MNKRSGSTLPLNQQRRSFLKQSLGISALAVGGSILPYRKVFAQSSLPTNLTNSRGYIGQRKDPITGCYHLGNGYRMFNPKIACFQSADNLSPFGKGGRNSYAYSLGDPINKTDPTGHFAIMSIVFGAITGAVVGATISAVSEGVTSAITGESFDWKKVGIGSALGFISGGFGSAALGAKSSVKVGLAVGESIFSTAADFGLNLATGASARESGINAGIGGFIGLGAFGVGHAVSAAGLSLSRLSHRANLVTTGGLSGGRNNVDNLATIDGAKRVLVGYHGTSSKFKKSLMKGVDVQKYAGKSAGLKYGEGFYTAFDYGTAQGYSLLAHNRHKGFLNIRRRKPIVMGAYISSDDLTSELFDSIDVSILNRGRRGRGDNYQALFLPEAASKLHLYPISEDLGDIDRALLGYLD